MCFDLQNDELETIVDGTVQILPAWEIDTTQHPQPSPDPATGSDDSKPVRFAFKLGLSDDISVTFG